MYEAGVRLCTVGEGHCGASVARTVARIAETLADTRSRTV